jgi:hypothetical protein
MKDNYNKYKIKYKISILIINIIFIVLNLFYINYYRFGGNIKLFLFELLDKRTNLAMSENMIKLSKMGMSYFDAIFYVLKTEGQQMLLISISFIFLILILKNKLFIKINRALSISLLICIFALSFIYYSSRLGIFLGGDMFSGQRLLSYAFLMVPIFNGIFIKIFTKKSIKFVLFAILMCASELSVLNLFPSPIVTDLNPVLMRSEICSTKYLITMKIPEKGVTGMLGFPYRIINGIIDNNKISSLNLRQDVYLPDHFGYYNSSSISNILNSDLYLYYTQMDYLAYNTVFKPVGRFLFSDYEMLYKDINVEKIYANGNVNICYLIS